jgi:REP element-mobilizing transposase RayT
LNQTDESLATPFVPLDWQPEPKPSPQDQGYLEDMIAAMNVPKPDFPPPHESSLRIPVPDEDYERRMGDMDPDYLGEPPPLQDLDQELKPRTLTEAGLEPVSPALHNLVYTCLLIPRMPDHNLVGNLARNLSLWISQLCVAFNWRLEHLSIRPRFMHWVVWVPPDTSPIKMIQELGKHTSDRVFNEYPHFSRDNPSREFWAPGYLILSGEQILSVEMIKEYVNRTRAHQGTELLRPQEDEDGFITK